MNAFSRTVSRKSSPASASCACFPRLFGLGIGTKYELTRLPSTTSSVMPSSENRKCRPGSSNGELRIGFSIVTCPIRATHHSPNPSSSADQYCHTPNTLLTDQNI